jgi:hypothetical protein
MDTGDSRQETIDNGEATPSRGYTAAVDEAIVGALGRGGVMWAAPFRRQSRKEWQARRCRREGAAVGVMGK